MYSTLSRCLRLTPSGRWTTYWQRRISATYRTVSTRRSTRIPSRIFGGGSTRKSENGVFMKIILIGANGKIGELIQKALGGAGHEIFKVGHKSGAFDVEIEERECVRKLYQAVGSFDAVA